MVLQSFEPPLLGHGDIAMVDLATLDQVCLALQVQPGELLVWQKRKDEGSMRKT